MNVLLTTWRLADHTGAELYARDLARALNRQGCRVAIYVVAAGPLARLVSAEGIEVITDPRRPSFTPDIIHGHHSPALGEALAAWPGCPAVSVTHDAGSPLDEPWPLERVRRYVAVDHRCLARLERDPAIPRDRQRVLLNFVDLARFAPRPALPARPVRALVFSNYAREGPGLDLLRQACAAAGLALDVMGSGVGGLEPHPERRLGGYDIVFAKARAAIEAMAVGCAVVLSDFAGFGEMVSAARFDSLRAMNFGAAVLTRPLTLENIAAELARYDPADAAAVSARIRAEAGLEEAAAAWLALYAEVLAEPWSASPAEAAVIARRRAEWRGRRWAARLQQRTRALRGGAIYGAGRALWRLAGSPGEVGRQRR